jgi:hypothetical protein
MVPRARQVEESAARLVRLVKGEVVYGGGSYVDLDGPAASSKQSRDDEVAAQLWALSAELTGAGGG